MRHLACYKRNGFVQATKFRYSTKIRRSGRITGTVKLINQRCKTPWKFSPYCISNISIFCKDITISRVCKIRTPEHVDMGCMAGDEIQALMNISHYKTIFGNLTCNPEKFIQGICCSYAVANRADPTDPLVRSAASLGSCF